MTHEEVVALWNGTPDSKRHKPRFLAEVWAARIDPSPSVERFIAALRFGAKASELDDPKTAPAYAARLIAALLEPFERLVETGTLDEVLPRLAGLPILYSPHAGKGAGGWEHAAELYKAKCVGAESSLEHCGNDSSRNGLWRNLAHDTVFVIQSARLNLPRFHQLRETGEPFFSLSKRREQRARKSFQFEVFRLPDDGLLAWPDWLDRCAAIPLREARGVPVKVRDARNEYLRAARAVLDNFFCDPDHPHADEIVKSVRGTRDGLPRASAVAEARKNILDTIARMEG